MAYYVEVWKLTENSESVVYAYSSDSSGEKPHGKLQIFRASGDTELLERAPDDEREHMFVRASWKLMKFWRQGVFPERTCWAS